MTAATTIQPRTLAHGEVIIVYQADGGDDGVEVPEGPSISLGGGGRDGGNLGSRVGSGGGGHWLGRGGVTGVDGGLVDGRGGVLGGVCRLGDPGGDGG
jgi:hypothetical protein